VLQNRQPLGCEANVAAFEDLPIKEFGKRVEDEINEVVFFLSGRWGYLAFPDGRGDLGGEEKLQEFRDTLAVFPALRAAQRTGTGTLRMRYDGGVVGPEHERSDR
jgi:hypothetical protein